MIDLEADSDESRRGSPQSGRLGEPIGIPAHLAHLDGLTGVMRALGRPEFYPALVQWVETVIPSDFWFIAHYRPNDKPTILHDTWQRSEAKNFYFSNVCQFDPVFFALGNHVLMQGTSISIMRDQFDIDPRYADYMENVAHIADELMILLPRPGGSCTAVCLDREDARFSADEVHYARRISALLAEIVGLHWERLPGARPAMAADGPLRRAPDEGDGGFPAAMQNFTLAHDLTRRESQIAALSLQGYPSATIAKVLGISQGAVKNHKLRLYRKLDITSERELVPLFLAVDHRTPAVEGSHALVFNPAPLQEAGRK